MRNLCESKDFFSKEYVLAPLSNHFFQLFLATLVCIALSSGRMARILLSAYHLFPDNALLRMDGPNSAFRDSGHSGVFLVSGFLLPKY